MESRLHGESSSPELEALRTAQEGAGANSSKLSHQVNAKSRLPYQDPEANSHHQHSGQKLGGITLCHTSQSGLLPASLPAQLSPHSSALQHTHVPLCLAHHNTPQTSSYSSSCVLPLKLVCATVETNSWHSCLLLNRYLEQSYC